MTKKKVLLLLLLTIMLFAFLPITRGEEKPLRLDSRLELFVDYYLVDSLKGTSLKLHEPRDEGAVFTFDKPWEGGSCAYITVFKDGDLYRMYYRGGPSRGKSDNSDEQTCYAESRDGIIWTRPKLGLFPFGDNKDNNIILQGNPHFSHNFAPFLDTKPGIPADQKYKALAGSSHTKLCAFISADGIHWKQWGDKPVIAFKKFALDSQNVSFWSDSEQKYICFARIWDGFRTIARCESNDFLHWTPDEGIPMTYGNTTREHLYTNQTKPYYRAPHIYLSTAARFMEGKQVITSEEAVNIQVDKNQINGCSDSVLMATRGGNVYARTFMEGLIRPASDPGDWTSRTNYPACGIVQTGPEEMSIYVQRFYSQPRHCLHRYSIRIDGFISINAPYQGGEFLTKYLTFTGKNLFLNFSTSAPGSIQVEFQDEQGKPIPGYELVNSPTLSGNNIAKEVRWKNGITPEKLAGKTIRIRFVMKDADLYSLQFK